MRKESTSLQGKHGKALHAEDPVKECQDHLRECVCLFLIYGVLSNQDWDWINSSLIKYGDSRSCIITISLEESVAKHCAVSYIDGVLYNVKGLHAAVTVELFQKVCLVTSRLTYMHAQFSCALFQIYIIYTTSQQVLLQNLGI